MAEKPTRVKKKRSTLANWSGRTLKFVTVVAIFMHLRYDLKGYRYVFTIAVVVAILMFIVMLAVFQAF